LKIYSNFKHLKDFKYNSKILSFIILLSSFKSTTTIQIIIVIFSISFFEFSVIFDYKILNLVIINVKKGEPFLVELDIRKSLWVKKALN
jgi:hypothetical protein